MATLTEILILHGLLPIEVLNTLMAGDPAAEGAVRRLVDSGVTTELQFAKARAVQAQGRIALRDDGWAKVRLGLTSNEEILRVVA